ncbi:MAG TPA: hypothetical protein DHU55_11565 [Blastocatellia bacterium]|nr:hypothetical protein [Blastocatellia bacterium]
MTHSFLALAFQEPQSDLPMWIIIAVVLVLLFFVVLIIGVGLTIFFVARKRSKARKLQANSARVMSSGPGPSSYEGMPPPEIPQAAVVFDAPPPAFETPAPLPEPNVASVPEGAFDPADSGAAEFDPSRTVAITREKTVAITYGSIKFTSGVLAGQQFDVKPEGSYIGRESSLSQIVVSDPRISKRHLWIGVRDSVVKIVDQDSRNGTFINDPKSERVTEATLNSGDTVILGESDVARFEYEA